MTVPNTRNVDLPRIPFMSSDAVVQALVNSMVQRNGTHQQPIASLIHRQTEEEIRRNVIQLLLESEVRNLALLHSRLAPATVSLQQQFPLGLVPPAGGSAALAGLHLMNTAPRNITEASAITNSTAPATTISATNSTNQATSSRKRSRDDERSATDAYSSDGSSSDDDRNVKERKVSREKYPLRENKTAVKDSSKTGSGSGKMIPLSMDSDRTALTKYQALVRENVYLFEATSSDLQRSAQGRNKPIVHGQVGVVCKHCAFVKASKRRAGSCYFPSRQAGVYQAVQNMVVNHFLESCALIPPETRETMRALKEKKETLWGGGRKYWLEGVKKIGLVEREGYLVFGDRDKCKQVSKIESA